MENAVYWQKQDLNDYEPMAVDFSRFVVVTRLDRLVVKSMRTAFVNVQMGKSKISWFRFPRGCYYLAHTSGMTGEQCARVSAYLMEGRTDLDGDGLLRIWGNLEHYVVKVEYYEKYCLEAMSGFYNYEIGRWGRQNKGAGVVEFKGDREVLCPAFVSDQGGWRGVMSPIREVLMMPNEEGLVRARLL